MVDEQPVNDDADDAVEDQDEAEKLLSHLTPDTLRHLGSLLAFAVVDETGKITDSGKVIGRSDKWVREAIDELGDSLGVKNLLTLSDRRQVPSGQIALEVRRIARSVLYQVGAVPRLADENIRVRYLPQHGFFMAAVEAQLGHQMNLHPKTLGEEDRAVVRFREEVLAAVAAGTVDLAIGLPPDRKMKEEGGLRLTYLYSSRQEAMVPRTEDAPDRITLVDLVEKGDLLLPPPHTRSRETLEARYRVDSPNGGELVRQVKREAYGTKVLIEYGMNGLGTVVVPSDIAHVFKHGNDYGGPPTARFQWIPVVDANGDLIHQPVYATMRRDRDGRTENVLRILEAVRRQVALLNLETDPTEAGRLNQR